MSESEMNSESQGQGQDIRFLIATDIHLGHKQSCPIRKDDSFKAFEEVLELAEEKSVDFLLLGGDLFDQVNPSPQTIYRCLDILQQKVYGERSDKEINAYINDKPDFVPNFKHQNLNIKLPVFTIHGNHDYPSNDFGKLSICDLLHVTKYANYFGKNTSLKQIVVKPLMIEKKGIKSKVAIYGLGYIKDDVIHELFQRDRVTFEKPEDPDSTFCLFILHQNRYKKGDKVGAPFLKCVSSKYIPEWMDLTIWGHQHQAIPKVEDEDGRKIFQPGSTVITSFIEAQSHQKQAVLISVDQSCNITPVPLVKSFRPMVCRSFQIAQLLSKCSSPDDFDVYAFIDKEIHDILVNLQSKFQDVKPIIRIKMEYSGAQISRRGAIEMKYLDMVANPQKIITFWKRKQPMRTTKPDNEIIDALTMKKSLYENNRNNRQELMQIFSNKIDHKLKFYTLQSVSNVCNSLVNNVHNPKGHIRDNLAKIREKKIKSSNKEIQAYSKNISYQLDKTRSFYTQQIQNSLMSKQHFDNQQQITYQKQKQKDTCISGQAYKTYHQMKESEFQTKQFQIFPEVQQPSSVKRQSSSNKNAKVQKKRDSNEQQNDHKKSGKSISTLEFLAQDENIKQNFDKQQIQDLIEKKQRKSILKNKKTGRNKINEDSDYQISASSEQDCCEKASKQTYNENRGQSMFNQAHSMIQNHHRKNDKKKLSSVQFDHKHVQKKNFRNTQ